MATSSGTLAIGTVTSGINTTTTIAYAVNGIFSAKTAMTSQVLTNINGPLNGPSVTSYTQPASTTVYYVLCLDSVGTVSVVQGSYAGQPLGGGAIGNGDVPDVSATVCPFGMIKIVLGATTFTAGTTLLGAANVTATYFNLLCIPATNP